MTDEIIRDCMAFMDSFRVPFAIANNTLLSLYRDGKPFEHPNREFVAFVPSEYREMFANHPAHVDIMPSVTDTGNINLQLEGKIGRLCLIFLKSCNEYEVQNVYQDAFFIHKRGTIRPFWHMIYNGQSIPIPNNPDRYLSEYYGDWRTPVAEWHWDKSPFLIRANSVKEAIERYESNLCSR